MLICTICGKPYQLGDGHNHQPKQSEKMPKRLYATKANVATEFKLTEAIEYLSLIEHTHLLAEKEKRIEALEDALKDAEKIIAGSVGSVSRLCEELWASSKSQEWIKNKMLSMPLLIEIKEYYAKRREALAASAKGV